MLYNQSAMIIRFTLLIMTSVLIFSGSASAEIDEERANFIQAREQGVLYWQKRRYRVAKRALLEAVNLPGGKKDFKTLYFLALVHHKLLQFGPTLTYIDLANIVDAGSLKRKTILREIQADIRENYGLIKLTTAPHSKVTLGTFRLNTLTKFLNKNKRRYVERMRELHETRPVRLPKRLYLPYGKYNVSGLHVELDMQSSGSELAIFLDEFDGASIPANVSAVKSNSNSNVWWIVGSVGATAVAGIATFLLLSNSGAEPGSGYRISVRN